MPDASKPSAGAHAANRPVVALLLTPETRAQVLTDEAFAALSEAAQIVIPDAAMSTETLPRWLAGARAALTGWGTPPLTDAMLAQCPDLALVAHSAGSIRRLVPPDAISEGRLRVSHSAIDIARAVAEFVIATTLAHLRNPDRLDAGLKGGAAWFDLRRDYLGRLLGDLTIGIVGAGYVGRLVIALFKAFGCRILVSDPLLSEERAKTLGVERGSLHEVLAAADVVSLHVPVLEETRHMIGAGQLALLRDGSLFINTARSAIVDEQALAEALAQNRFTAAIDVFDTEPLPPDSPFRTLPNAIISPHAAGHTLDTHHRQGATAVAEIRRFLAGEPLQHEVTAGMLATMA